MAVVVVVAVDVQLLLLLLLVRPLNPPSVSSFRGAELNLSMTLSLLREP